MDLFQAGCFSRTSETAMLSVPFYLRRQSDQVWSLFRRELHKASISTVGSQLRAGPPLQIHRRTGSEHLFLKSAWELGQCVQLIPACVGTTEKKEQLKTILMLLGGILKMLIRSTWFIVWPHLYLYSFYIYLVINYRERNVEISNHNCRFVSFSCHSISFCFMHLEALLWRCLTT